MEEMEEEEEDEEDEDEEDEEEEDDKDEDDDEDDDNDDDERDIMICPDLFTGYSAERLSEMAKLDELQTSQFKAIPLYIIVLLLNMVYLWLFYYS